ncbi:RNA polymerase sigma factor [Bacteroides pyogenes]|uniref:RNA polymerase sigma factor n=1 Tax=Bacteroides pyogenes TaxID=310300 RepID=UPI003B42E01F
MSYDEEKLIKELTNDSQKALSEIYRLYAPRIYAFGLRYCKSHEKVEELVSDTFLWLWNNRHNIYMKHSLKSILFLRMRHFLINNYRATIHSPEYENYLEYRESIANVPNDPLEYDDFVRRLHACINALPPIQAKVVRMAKFDMLNNRTIADRLNIAEQTVKNLLSLGLKAMRKQLQTAKYLPLLLFYVN